MNLALTPATALVIRYVRKHTGNALVIIITGLICHALTMMMILGLGVFLQIFSGNSGGKLAVVAFLGLPFPQRLESFLLFYLLAMLLRLFLSWFKYYREGMMGEDFAAWLKQKLFLHMNRKKDLNQPVSGMVISFANEARAMQQLLVKGHLVFMSDLLFLLLAIVVMFQLSPSLTFAIVAVLLLYAVLLRYLGHLTKSSSARKRKSHSAIMKLVIETFSVSASGTSLSEKRFGRRMNRFRDSVKPYLRVQAFLRALYPFQMYFLLWLVMLLLVFQQELVRTEAGMLTAYILLLLQLFPVIKAVMRAENWRNKGAVSAKSYYFILDERGDPGTEPLVPKTAFEQPAIHSRPK